VNRPEALPSEAGVPGSAPSASVPAEAPPAPRRLRRLKLVSLTLLAICLAADLVSKDMLADMLILRPGQPASVKVIDVIPGFFALEGTWNPGVTFGLARGRTFEILILTSVATVALLTWLLATRNPSRLLHVGLGLIISGAIGNLYDRLRWHEVRDFFLVYLGDRTNPDDWKWPNFNVADACIVMGVCLVILDALFGKQHRPEPRGQPSAQTGVA
jgi:signal peptidase II